MTRTGNTQQGKIYKLVSFQTDECYIGSTSQKLLSMRMSKHKCDYKRWMENKQHYTSACELLKYDDCKIILIENHSCNDIYELEARERHFIENTDKCVNIHRPTRSKQENMEDKKDHYQRYKQEWYLKNKDTHNLKSKELYENNKEARKIKAKEWYEKNKDTLNLKGKERIMCECGIEVCRGYLQRHIQTDKHKRCLVPS